MDREGHLEDAEPTAIEQFSPEEAEAIETEAWRRRLLDLELADELDEREPTTHAATSRYLHDLAVRPGMSAGLEHELVLAAKLGDSAAKARLIEAFLPLIASIARIYRNTRAVDRIELMQEGVVGLLRALECYDATRGTPFGAYASWWVRQAMQRLVAELTRPIVLSDRALRQLARINDAHRAQLQAGGREPSASELAAQTGLTRGQVESLIAAERTPRGLHEPLAGEEGRVGALGDLLVDPLAEDEYERVVSRLEIEELRGLLSGLSDRERAILRARYRLDGPEQTLREIGAGHGLSAERVRQIEHRALGKLRAAAAAPAAVDGSGGRPSYEIETSGLSAGAQAKPSEIWKGVIAMTMLMERFAPLFELQRDLNRFLAPGGAAFMPAADVLTTEEEVLVHMDVPGLRADELEIELDDDVLTVRGERIFPYGREDGGSDGGYAWQLIERNFGRFERVLRVPAGLDPDAIEAAVADGVLTLRIPKPEKLKPRRIRIGAAANEQRELEGAAS